MKKIIYILVLFLFAQGITAQDKKKIDRIKSLKIAHITTELDLTPAEAEKILPVYNAYCDKVFELKQNCEFKFIRKTNIEDINKMSEKEASEVLQKIIKNETEYLALKKKLVDDLQKILSAKRIIQFKKAEDDFNMKLFKQYKRKK